MNINELMAAVRGVIVTREIARLMPTSGKTEPVQQRRNPARDAKRAKRLPLAVATPSKSDTLSALEQSNRRFQQALADWERGVVSTQWVEDAEFECEMAQRAFIAAGGTDAELLAVLDTGV